MTMNKLIYLFIATFLFIGCNKNLDTDLTFDKLPEERIAERNAELKNKLLESPDGWKAFLRTNLRGGAYGFYMQFNENDKVTMLSDWSNVTATTPDTSTYRVKYVMNSSLIFDTYNYLSILQNPSANANGGTNANGLQSDIEFEYLRSTADSIILKGKKYGNILHLVKASEAERMQFENGGYLTSIDKFKNYFLSGFPHIVLNQGGINKKIELWTNNSTKVADGDYVSPENNLTSAISGFAFAIDGAYFSNGLVTEGVKFTGLRWKGENQLIAFDSVGTEYPVNLSSVPITLLHLALGTKFKLQAVFKKIYPGTSTAGAAIVGHYVNNLDNAYSGYRFQNGTLTFNFDIANKRLIVTGWHNQNDNAGWNTTITYTYSKDANGIYTFNHVSGPATPQSGANGYVQTLMSQTGKETIDKFLRNNRVTFDYYTQDGMTYGRMTSVENPSIVMTYALVR